MVTPEALVEIFLWDNISCICDFENCLYNLHQIERPLIKHDCIALFENNSDLCSRWIDI